MNQISEIELSFIVPVYNTEEFVIRCLNSLVNQNIPISNYEIIVVIDGSPDNSINLIKQFAINNTNIEIIEQNNQGLSEARNNGLKIAKGKYIWFIDSDDWITNYCLFDLLQIMNNADLDMFGVAPSIPYQEIFNNCYNYNSSLSVASKGKERLINGDFVIGAWCYIFKKDFLKQHNLTFLRGVYWEDEEFIPRALFYAERVMMLLNFSVYNYFIRENSITKSISQKAILDRLLVAKSLDTFNNECIGPNLTSIKKTLQHRIIILIISGINNICKQKKGLDFLRKYIEFAKNEGLYPFKIKYCYNTKTQLILILCNFSPSIYFMLRNFKKP